MNIQEVIKKLPDSPGVYFFKDTAGNILYVGKATSLINRVRSYFLPNVIDTRGQLIVNMVRDAATVDFIKTDSVLEALILEASLIKKHQPPHNTRDKDDKSFSFVIITKEKFPRVLVVRGREIEKLYNDPKLIKEKYGPFPNGGALRIAMKIIRRTFPYRDNKCVPPKDVTDPKLRPCFNYQIGLCPGVCIGKVTAQEYGKTIKHLMMFFDGKKKQLLKSLEKDMKAYAKNHEFEKADKAKRTIFALQHIQDVALIHKEDIPRHEQSNNRLEAYDIAHLAGSSSVGVMTVLENGHSVPAEYRMFRIRQKTNGDDLKALEEVLTRRFKHPEWPYPQIIVIDGGQTHLKAAEKALGELDIRVPVVSVVKDDKHKPKDVLGDEKIVSDNHQGILLVNSEAHRFAIKYHRKVRGKNFLWFDRI